MHLEILLGLGISSFAIGLVTGLMMKKIPMRGWMAVLLLILSAMFWMLSQPSNSEAPERLWTLPCFTFLAPIAIIYSFRARNRAPDRLLAKAAFACSFLIAAFLVFLICGLGMGIYTLFLLK